MERPNQSLSIIGPVKQKINFLPNNFKHIYLGGSKEQSCSDGSFEYPQHMFWLRNQKINVQLSIPICSLIMKKSNQTYYPEYNNWKNILLYCLRKLVVSAPEHTHMHIPQNKTTFSIEIGEIFFCNS